MSDPGAWNSIWISCVGGKDPANGVIICYLTRYTLGGSWNWKQSEDSSIDILIGNVSIAGCILVTEPKVYPGSQPASHSYKVTHTGTLTERSVGWD